MNGRLRSVRTEHGKTRVSGGKTAGSHGMKIQAPGSESYRCRVPVFSIFRQINYALDKYGNLWYNQNGQNKLRKKSGGDGYVTLKQPERIRDRQKKPHEKTIQSTTVSETVYCSVLLVSLRHGGMAEFIACQKEKISLL